MPAPQAFQPVPLETSPSPLASSIQLRRQEEKEQRRQAILDAAERIIAEKSWAETNFSEIAKLTRLSRSLIYVYFPTRDDLHHAICNRSAAVIQVLFAEAIASGGTGLDRVEAIGRAYHRFSREYPVYFKLHAEQEATAPSAAAPQPYSHPAFSLLAQAIAEGIADGSIKPGIGDVKTTVLTLWTFTHGLLLIASRKADFLRDRMNLETRAMIDHGFALMRSMLAP